MRRHAPATRRRARRRPRAWGRPARRPRASPDGSDERAAAGRDREPAGDAPAGRDGCRSRGPDGVTSAAAVGRDAVAVAGVQAGVALLQHELRGWPRRRARSRWRRRGCAGARCARSPVRSITPITAPVSGSWIGAALHVQRCTGSLKCSGPKTWTAWSSAIAVPIAFVPAPPSLHSVPSAKFMSPAARRRTGGAALDRHQHAVGVRDHDQVAGLVGDRRQALVDQRRRRRRAGAPRSARASRPRRRRPAPSRPPVGSTPAG